MNRLSQFFKSPLYQQVLGSYARKANSLNWQIGDKLQMYNWAKIAFESDTPEDRRRQVLAEIYDQLRRYWQVFRNGQGGHWTSDQIFDALSQRCAACARESQLTLPTLAPRSTESKRVLATLDELKDLKRIADYPWMAVSKFANFFNPKLFPLYDRTVIWDTVLNGKFKDDYRDYCRSKGLNPNGPGAKFYLHYMLWAGDALRQADSDFMAYFAEGFRAQIRGEVDEQGVLDDVHQYYATAFEFVAIGAVELVK